jgi:hypothetical protein
MILAFLYHLLDSHHNYGFAPYLEITAVVKPA